MVQFTPRPLKENVNVTKTSPQREFLVLSLGLLGILLAVYIVLGISLNVLIDHMPSKVDQIAGKLFELKKLETPKKYSEAHQEVQKLLDDLTAFLPDSSLTYTVHIIESDDANAFAMPGGRIGLFTGFLNEVESENELAMVLGHELGHYANRDHLRALGRGIVFVVIASTLFGTDSGVTDLISGALSTVEMKFSRTQEEAADRFALNLMNKKYGHVAGSTDFFERIAKKRDLPKFFAFFSTHPGGDQRVNMINHTIGDLHYILGTKIPLSPIYMEQFQKKEENL